MALERFKRATISVLRLQIDDPFIDTEAYAAIAEAVREIDAMVRRRIPDAFSGDKAGG